MSEKHTSMGVAVDLQSFIAAFLAARLDTAAWCELEGKLSAFRTETLRPVLEDWPTASAFEAALDMVRRRRRELLRGRTSNGLPEGRLLICQVNESISSGESEHETSGFFDVHDRPPWDTWVWQLPSSSIDVVTLVSWVPIELEAKVSRGIAVNPYDCIYWLTDTPPGRPGSIEVQALRAAGMR